MNKWNDDEEICQLMKIFWCAFGMDRYVCCVNVKELTSMQRYNVRGKPQRVILS